MEENVKNLSNCALDTITLEINQFDLAWPLESFTVNKTALVEKSTNYLCENKCFSCDKSFGPFLHLRTSHNRTRKKSK